MALVFPARDACFLVFSQRADARIEVAEWARHGERFLRTRVERKDASAAGDGASSLRESTATIELGPLHEPGDPNARGVRTCWSRPRTEDDLVAATSAPGGAGLAALAERCPQVWLVGTEGRAEDDAPALRLAAILAGVLLGPILAPGGLSLFGPKTARQRLGL